MTPYSSLINQVNDSEEQKNKEKIQKINQGNYKGVYKGIQFEIRKIGEIKENAWYWLINNKGGNDWYPSKQIAINAVKDWIDNGN